MFATVHTRTPGQYIAIINKNKMNNAKKKPINIYMFSFFIRWNWND